MIYVMLLALMCQVASFAQQNTSDEPQPVTGRLSLDLSKAIEIALAENPTIQVAEKTIRLKEVADKEAWQALLPQANVVGSMTHTILAAEMKLNGNTFKMGRDGTTTSNVALGVNIPVFAPALYKTMKMTKADIELAVEQSRASKLDLVNQVTKAFYQTLLAQDSYDVMRQSYATSEENYRIVNAKYEHGAVSEYDAVSAEVQMRSMNASLTSSQNALRLAHLQLKVLMGVTADVELVISDKLENYENQLLLVDVSDKTRLLVENSQLKQLDMNDRLLDLSYKTLKTNFLPSLTFNWTFQYQSLYNNNWNVINYDWSPSSNFVLTLNIPIFKADNWTKLKSNRIQKMQLADNRLDVERKLGMALDSYSSNMASSIAQVESNRKAISQAEKARTISAKRYEVGRGTILELNQSETALTQARLTYSQSIYDYLNNKADLDYTMGKEF